MSRPFGSVNLRPKGHDAARTDFYEGVGRAVREAREAEGLTQTELARRIGIPQSALGAIEGNRTVCSLYMAARIAETLDITLEDIARVTVDERESA